MQKIQGLTLINENYCDGIFLNRDQQQIRVLWQIIFFFSV